MKQVSFATILTLVCVVVFIILELQSPTALILFISGVIARRWFQKAIDGFLEAHKHDIGWLYNHADLWANKVHESLNPTKCPNCNPKAAPKDGN